MTDLEKFFKVIGNIAKDNSNPRLQLGIYKGGGIEANGITIPPTMILKLDYLDEKRCKNVLVEGTNSKHVEVDEDHTHNWSMVDKSEYIEPLQDNDKVIFYMLDATKCLIIGRVR